MAPTDFQSKSCTRTIFITFFSAISIVACEGDKFAEERIIGGTRAQIGEFPFLVSVADIHYNHLCGASLINIKNLLTAAHCLVDEKNNMEDPEMIYLTAGEVDIVTKTSSYLQKLAIYAYVVHPKFDKIMKVNDISLIRLVEAVELSPGVNVIPFAKVRPIASTICKVAGWGTTATNIKGHQSNAVLTSQFLLKVDIPVLDFDLCQKVELGETHEESQLCAGVLKGGKDACWGDSGGPLLCSGVLAGIVSYGSGCGLAELPAIYTDVSHYASWIDDMIQWDGNTSMPRMKKIKNSTLNNILNGSRLFVMKFNFVLYQVISIMFVSK